MKIADKPYSIYAIHCAKTGRTYIGSTSNFEARIKAHFRELKLDIKYQYVRQRNERIRIPSQWQLDYNEHGSGAFEVFLIEENVSPDKQAELEAHYINLYHADNPNYGYNILPAKKPGIEFTRGAPPLPGTVKLPVYHLKDKTPRKQSTT